MMGDRKPANTPIINTHSQITFVDITITVTFLRIMPPPNRNTSDQTLPPNDFFSTDHKQIIDTQAPLVLRLGKFITCELVPNRSPQCTHTISPALPLSLITLACNGTSHDAGNVVGFYGGDLFGTAHCIFRLQLTIAILKVTSKKHSSLMSLIST
jgi:hypothetical protein